MIVHARFQSATYFSEGMARVSEKNLMGFINSSGAVVVPPQFTYADDFHDGLACVKIGEKFGFIDKTGKLTIKPTLDTPSHFSEGFAVVRRLGDAYSAGLIDQHGSAVPLPVIASYITDYSDGVAWIHTKGGDIADFLGQWVAVDVKQHVLISIPEQSVCAFRPGDFSEGLAPESLAGLGCDRKQGFINKAGQRVIEPLYDDPSSFSHGLANVTIDNKSGFIDAKGNQVIPPIFVSAGTFSEGLAFAAIPADLSAARTAANKLVAEHVAADQIVASLAWIPIANFGFVDETGKWVIKPIYTFTTGMLPFIGCSQMYTFKDGLAALILPPATTTGDPQFEYIDRTGKVIFGPTQVSATQMILETDLYLEKREAYKSAYCGELSATAATEK